MLKYKVMIPTSIHIRLTLQLKTLQTKENSLLAHNLRNLSNCPIPPIPPQPFDSFVSTPILKQAHAKCKSKMKVFFRNKRQIPDPDGQALFTLLNRRNSVA